MNEDLNWYPTNAGEDSRPVVWKLEGGQVLWMAASAALGLLLFRFFVDVLEWSVAVGLTLSAIVPVLTVIFLLRFVTGKPPSYATDYLEWKGLQTSQWLADRGIGDRTRPLFGGESKNSEGRNYNE